MNNPLEFTPREQFLISYYRNRRVSRGSGGRAYHIIHILAPLACLGLYMNSDETAWIFVAFALLFYRAIYSFWSSLTYDESFGEIFHKYDARIKELEAKAKDTP